MSDSTPTPLHRIGLVALGVFVAIALASTAASAGEANNGEIIELDENVSVWTDSTYAMNVKHPADSNVSTSPLLSDMPLRTVSGSTPSGTAIDGETNHPAASAIDAGSMLQFDFWTNQGAATKQFAGTNSSLIVAKLDSPADPAVDGAAELSPTRSAELLVAADRNDRASFDTQFTEDDTRDMRVVDDDGYFGSYYGLDEDVDSGVYAFYHIETTDGDEPTVDNGSLSIDGEITVLGIETAVVHDDESTADTADEHELGDSIEFSVDADGDTVDHTVAVFNESAIADEQLAVTTNETVDSDLEPAAVNVSTSAGVAGVADTEPASIFGATVDNNSAFQTSDVGVLASYLATADADNEGPAGSITARQAVNASEQLTVETLESWDEGSYTYLHIATADNGTTTSTSGTVELVEPESDDDSSSSSSSSSGSSSWSSSSSASTTSSNPMETNLTETTNGATLSVENAGSTDTLTVTPNTTAAGTTVTDMELDFVRTVGSFDAQISTDETTPADVPEFDSTALSYLTVDAEELSSTDHGTVTMQFSVDEERLSAVGADESDIRLYQTDGETWTELETESVGDGSYEATTTELSTFAIGSIEDAEEALTVHTATVDAETVAPNESVEVTATVENPTADDVGVEIDLEVDGTVETTLVETISAGETQQVSFELSPAETGSYDLRVAGTDAGTLAVSDDIQDETPGFGILAAVSALLAVLVGRRFYS